jgi:undecaprenyl-diphosphatase
MDRSRRGFVNGLIVATAVRWIRGQEAIVLVAALAIALALLGFIKTTDEVLEGKMRSFDERLLQTLRRPESPETPVGPNWLLEAAQDVTVLGSRTFLVLATVSVVGYLGLERKYRAMWLVAVAAAGGGFLTAALKHIVGRVRPGIVPHLVIVTSPSFPSGHAMLAAVVFLTLGAMLARFAARRRTKVYFLTLALLLTFLVGLSRVYLGVHYPTDVLAGWCAGLAWALMCWLVARYLQSRGAVEKPVRS